MKLTTIPRSLIIGLVCTLIFLVTATSCKDDSSDGPDDPIITAPLSTVLKFETTIASENFTLQAPNNWDGTLYYSTDLKTWTEWDGTQISSVYGKLYMRGIGNTVITGSWEVGFSGVWSFSGACGIACTGNIENLLDYEVVAQGWQADAIKACSLTKA